MKVCGRGSTVGHSGAHCSFHSKRVTMLHFCLCAFYFGGRLQGQRVGMRGWEKKKTLIARLGSRGSNEAKSGTIGGDLREVAWWEQHEGS